MGLSIATSLARAHGGEITLESTPGGGTTARVRLPQWLGDPSASPMTA
nr:ATP-binding protein [Hydrogenophaga sp.]